MYAIALYIGQLSNNAIIQIELDNSITNLYVTFWRIYDLIAD